MHPKERNEEIRRRPKIGIEINIERGLWRASGLGFAFSLISSRQVLTDPALRLPNVIPAIIFDLMPLFAVSFDTDNQCPDPLNAIYGAGAKIDDGGSPDSMGDFLRARDLASLIRRQSNSLG